MKKFTLIEALVIIGANPTLKSYGEVTNIMFEDGSGNQFLISNKIGNFFVRIENNTFVSKISQL